MSGAEREAGSSSYSRGASYSRNSRETRNPRSSRILRITRVTNSERRAAAELTMLYWNVGRRINQELLGNKRAEYGRQVIDHLSARLCAEFGDGWKRRQLFYCVQFSSAFPDLEIVHTLCAQLSWSHIKSLLELDDPLKREFYAEMCKIEHWSVRTLRGRIDAMMYYYIDLLFFHRRLRRLVAIDLKIDSFKAEYKGQMELYLRWLDKNEKCAGEKPPIGLILCAGKNEEHVRLLELDRSNIRVATYLTELPPRKLLEAKFRQAIEIARNRVAQLEERS